LTPQPHLHWWQCQICTSWIARYRMVNHHRHPTPKSNMHSLTHIRYLICDRNQGRIAHEWSLKHSG
jgi:hypothetical protein